MDSKNAVFLILGLLAMDLLISLGVSARDLTETSSNTKKEVNDVENGNGEDGENGNVGYNTGYPDEGDIGYNSDHGDEYPENGDDFPENGWGYNGGYPGHGWGYSGGYPENGRSYHGGFYPGHGGFYPGHHGHDGVYFGGYGDGYLGHGGFYYGGGFSNGGHKGETVDVKTKDNTHN